LQAKTWVAPVAAVVVPDRQAVQLPAPAEEYLPTTQAVQEDLPAVEEVPGGQVAQVAVPEADEKVPAGHWTHGESSQGAYAPGPQARHASSEAVLT